MFGSPSGKGTVLILDDDASARAGLSRYVGCAGYTVQTFASAEEFSQARVGPEAVCLVADVRMRGGGWLLLAEQLRVAGYSMPVILVSADDGAEVRQRALALGAAGFFHKPVDGRALLDAIEWARTARSWRALSGGGDSSRG
jgi:FixJ family two-component response regulator